jgi:hypothetical protein
MLVMNQERLAALDHYESDRTYRLDYKGAGGAHHAELQVHADYTGPDHKRLTVVAESGSKFLCDKVLRKLVAGEQEATAQSNRRTTARNWQAKRWSQRRSDRYGPGCCV